MKTKTSPSKKSTEVGKSLYKFLASTYALYLKTQNFHWNVKGSHFIALHLLFEKQYDELAKAIDQIAERVATLGLFVDGSFSAFGKSSILKEPKKQLSANQMLKELSQDHEALSQYGLPLILKFQELGDEVSADLMIQRLAVHDKASWMLKSHLTSE